MPRLPAKQREAEKIATPLSNGGFAASSNDVPARLSWDHHANSLLTTMPGDKRKRKQTLEKIISALDRRREEFRKEKKTGAGSATEAISFYRHVLFINQNFKGHRNNYSGGGGTAAASAGGGASDGTTVTLNNSGNTESHGRNEHGKRPLDTSSSTQSHSTSTTNTTTVSSLPIEPPKKRKRGRPRKYPKPSPAPSAPLPSESESVPSESIPSQQQEEETSTSVPPSSPLDPNSTNSEEEFLNQHHDYCIVCKDGGSLLCCATCNLSFHLQCVRPVLKALPENDDWSCAFCDASGITGFKKESRNRKRAGNAVREMTRMQNKYAATVAATLSLEQRQKRNGVREMLLKNDGKSVQVQVQQQQQPLEESSATTTVTTVTVTTASTTKGDDAAQAVDQPMKGEGEADEASGDTNTATEDGKTSTTIDATSTEAQNEDTIESTGVSNNTNNLDTKTKLDGEEGNDDLTTTQTVDAKISSTPQKPKLSVLISSPADMISPTQTSVENDKTKDSENFIATPTKTSTNSDGQNSESIEKDGIPTTTTNNTTSAYDTIPQIGVSPGGGILVGGPNGSRSRHMKEVFDNLSPLNFDQPRSRRQRRQPMMYNPQSCPASDWQSDGKNEWKYLSTDDVENIQLKRKREGDSDEVVGTDGVSASVPVEEDEEQAKAEAVTEVDDEEQEAIVPYTREDIPLTLLKKFNAQKSKPMNSRHGQFNCRYCMDDESIQTCCFCACRICFSKHSKEDIILCDLCDSEFHMSCLAPPLKKLPENEWFCPICVQQIDEAKEAEELKMKGSRSSRKGSDKLSTSSTKSAKAGGKTDAKTKSDGRAAAAAKQPRTSTGRFAPSHRKRNEAGRFTSSSLTSAITTASTSDKPSTSASQPDSNEPPPVKKRGPGRPPKSKNKKTLLALAAKKAPSSASPKSPPPASGEKRRGPGRPPKSKNKNTSEMVASRVLSSRTRRAAAAAAAAANNKFGKPSSDAEKGENDGGVSLDSRNSSFELDSSGFPLDSVGTIISQPIKRSRSGRVVKRNTHYDEIGEGQQHLKSHMRAAFESGRIPQCTMKDVSPKESAVQETKTAGPSSFSFVRVDEDDASMKNKYGMSKEEIQMASIAASDAMKGILKESKVDLGQARSFDTKVSDASRISSMQTSPTSYQPNNVSSPKNGGTIGVDSSISSHNLNTAASQLSMKDSPPSITNIAGSQVLGTSKTKIAPGAKHPLSSPPAVGTSRASTSSHSRSPRRKPGARECMQMSRRFGAEIIPQQYVDTLMDYCSRGKVEHLIRMRERLDEHSRFLECQLAGLEMLVQREQNGIESEIDPSELIDSNNTTIDINASLKSIGMPPKPATIDETNTAPSVTKPAKESEGEGHVTTSSTSQAPSQKPSQTQAATTISQKQQSSPLRQSSPLQQSSPLNGKNEKNHPNQNEHNTITIE